MGGELNPVHRPEREKPEFKAEVHNLVKNDNYNDANKYANHYLAAGKKVEIDLVERNKH